MWTFISAADRLSINGESVPFKVTEPIPPAWALIKLVPKLFTVVTAKYAYVAPNIIINNKNAGINNLTNSFLVNLNFYFLFFEGDLKELFLTIVFYFSLLPFYHLPTFINISLLTK